MRLVGNIQQKIKTVAEAKKIIAAWKVLGKTVAFTNGCFDILHPGHLYSLAETAKEADYLIVGLNSDASVKRLKGPERPINNTNDRALILANLILVDMVVIFEEDTPLPSYGDSFDTWEEAVLEAYTACGLKETPELRSLLNLS